MTPRRDQFWRGIVTGIPLGMGLLLMCAVGCPRQPIAHGQVFTKVAPAMFEHPGAWSTLLLKGSTMQSVAEAWRSIEGHEFYEVSNLGRVRSLDRHRTHLLNGRQVTKFLRGKVLSSKPGGHGYLQIHLGANCRRYVHHLVAEAFIGPRAGRVINHLDGNKLNNTPANLEWTSYAENLRHAIATGLHSGIGETHWNRKLTNEDVREVRRLRAQGESADGIAERFDISTRHVRCLVNHEQRATA